MVGKSHAAAVFGRVVTVSGETRRLGKGGAPAGIILISPNP